MNVAEPHASETLDLHAIYERVVRRIWLVAAGATLGGLLALVVAIYSQPVYRAATVMVSAHDEQGLSGSVGSALGALGGLAALAGRLDSKEAVTEEALAVLRSRQFTESFIADHQLMRKFFAGKWDEEHGRWKGAVEDQPTPAKTYKYFDRKIRSITNDRKTGLITLRIEWRDRGEAAQWANELVTRLNAEMRRRAIADAQASVGFLEKELDTTTTVATREAINRLIEAQIRQRMLANVTHEYAFRIVDQAMAPDADDYVRPRRVLMVGVGLLLGALFGVIAALFTGKP